MVIRVREAARPLVTLTDSVGANGAARLSVLPRVGRSRLDLFGVQIDRVDRPSALSRIRTFLEDGSTHQIVTVNLDFLYLAEQNPQFCTAINEADLAVADGMPLVWLSRVMGEPLPGRITGVELVDECCRIAHQEGVGVFFIGGTPPIAAIAADRVREQYPGLEVTHYSPPFGPIPPGEDEHIIEMVQRVKPGFLFVSLGAPRQDLWIRAHRERLGVPVSLGVGCVVDLLAGAVRRAPPWMQATGFEWSYRLMQEPRRLWRRYLLDDLPHFGRLSVMALDAHRSTWRTARVPADGGPLETRS
jgi:N-acetylglucosaminyldiphosphoundecaprenol N-acetyl-beta-D-mannosaminyltransferase